jgi:hypothetical protein
VLGRHEIVELLEGEELFAESVGAAHGMCRFRSLMGYSDNNPSRHQGVDREARYFSSLLGDCHQSLAF